MSLNVSAEVEARILANAEQAGVSIEDYLEQVRAPTPMLTAPGPNDAGQATASQADQGAERLAYGALKGALLGEHRAPVGDDVEEGGEQSHRASGDRKS